MAAATLALGHAWSIRQCQQKAAATAGVRLAAHAAAVALGMDADHFVPLLDKCPTVMRATTTSGARAPRCRSTDRCAWARDAVIEWLPTCSEASNPPRHAPVTSGDHLMSKLMGSRLLRRSEQSQRR